MTQINDRRPRDWAYQISFNRKDLPLLIQMTKRIHQNHDMREVEAMHRKCESILAGRISDKTFSINDQSITIQAVNKSVDLAVNVGMQQCINIILGTSTTRWRYMQFTDGIGAGNPVSVNDTQLEGIDNYPMLPPFNPIDMSGLLGWREAVGMRLFFGGIRSQTTQTGDVSGLGDVGEIGVVTANSQASAILLNRSKFVNNHIPNNWSEDLNVNRHVDILSCVIEFCPVA